VQEKIVDRGKLVGGCFCHRFVVGLNFVHWYLYYTSVVGYLPVGYY
jgi:hypothetical protein